MKTLASLRVLVVGGGFAGMSATPAMTMAGAALGALIGETLVKVFGFGGIPLAARVLAAFAGLCFSRLQSAGALHSHKDIFE